MEGLGKHRFHEVLLEQDSKMRLLKTRSHTCNRGAELPPEGTPIGENEKEICPQGARKCQIPRLSPDHQRGERGRVETVSSNNKVHKIKQNTLGDVRGGIGGTKQRKKPVSRGAVV